MSALTRSRTASTTTTSAPAPAPTTAAAPQHTGNQAAQDRAGTSGPAPAPATGLDDALGGLGELSSVVLDALPEAVALPMAWARRGDAWARQWLDTIPTAAILAAAPELLKEAIDIAWPDGAGFQAQLDAKLGLGVDCSGAESLSMERRGGCLRVKSGGSGALTKAGGLGEMVEGAGGKKSLGLAAEAGSSTGAALEQEWELPVADLLEGACGAPRLLLDLAFGRKSPAVALAGAVTTAIQTVAPVKTRAAGQRSVTANANAAFGPIASESASLDGAAGIALEQEEGVGCVEFFASALLAARKSNILSAVLAAVGVGPGDLEARLGLGGRLRILGDPAALAGADVEGLAFEVVVETSLNDSRVTDTLAFADIRALGDWVMLGNIDRMSKRDVGPQSVPPEDLPDVALTRSFERSVGTLSDLETIAPDLGEEAHARLARLLEVPDVLQDGMPVDFQADATAEAKIRVPVDAARAALAGQALPVSPLLESAEGQLLEVERAVLASVLRPGTPSPAGLPQLDLEAAAPLVEMDDATVKLAVGLNAGLAGAVALGPVASLGANLGGALTLRLPIEDLPADQRAALLAG